MENEIKAKSMEQVTGGNSMYDLSNFNTLQVKNLAPNSALALCDAPGGNPIPGIAFSNNESILVNISAVYNGWYLATKNGAFGYVNSAFITSPFSS